MKIKFIRKSGFCEDSQDAQAGHNRDADNCACYENSQRQIPESLADIEFQKPCRQGAGIGSCDRKGYGHEKHYSPITVFPDLLFRSRKGSVDIVIKGFAVKANSVKEMMQCIQKYIDCRYDQDIGAHTQDVGIPERYALGDRKWNPAP